MKRKLVVIALMVGAYQGFSQSIAPQVVASAGDHYVAVGVQLSWTTGESMIDTYTAGGSMITQGFHQTQLTITAVEEQNPHNLQVSIYPNPTSEQLTISIPENENDMTMNLFDMNGKLILSEQLSGTEKRLNVSALADAYYILQLQSEAINYSSTHKIQKTQN
jgi:hypothetical protein